jgi:CubicO group peptidase (beta-lactamase class C family)
MLIDEATRRQFLYGVTAFSAAPIAAPSEFRDFYLAALQKNNIVGSTFLLIRDNAVALKQFHGYSDLANKTPIDWNTCYHWASITKTFTAVAILQLRDRGASVSMTQSDLTHRSCAKSTIQTGLLNQLRFVTS